MRIIAGLAALLVLACDQEPTLADVAGVYELTLDEEYVIPEKARWSLDFKPDGTFSLIKSGKDEHSPPDTSSWFGAFSIAKGEAGCVDIFWESPPEEFVYGSGTICGDTLTHTPYMAHEGERVVLILVKR